MTLLFLYNQVSHAMSVNYFSVVLDTTVRDAMKYMHQNQQNCVLVVDSNNLLEGILTRGDIKRYLSKKSAKVISNKSIPYDVRGIMVYRISNL